ncbi:MAG: hypothetical protein QTN59_17385 [Candidatus Electrothrix communis]|nr:MAG: hypothetical protein QTN59_17385 [Candidatus Electrothrix communis]
MKYQLISSGRLLVGSEEQKSIHQIQRITRLSEEQIRKSLLNGKPKKMLSSDDKKKVKKAALALRQAGLEVKIQVRQTPSEAETDGPGAIAPSKEKRQTKKERIDYLPFPVAPAKKKTRFGRCLVYFFLLLLTLASAGIGYGWYWLYRPLPAGVAAAEQALFDGNLVIAGLVDFKKITLLEQYWFGELDPKALPLDSQQQRLLNNLLSGTPKFRETLTHILYSASAGSEQQQGRQLMLLAGKFVKKSLLKTLGGLFQLQQIDKKRWRLNPLTPSNTDSSRTENTPKTEQKGFYLQITPDWLILSTDSAYADHIWGRLSSGQKAQQDVSAWHRYRKGKFISFMVLDPNHAGRAIGGMPGMMTQGVASQTPQVNALAAGLEAHPLKGGLNINVHLFSADAAWNASTASGIEKKLTDLKQNSRSTSPSLSGLLSRIKASDKADAVDIDIRLDAQLLNDTGQVINEGISNVFAGIANNSGTAGGPVPEQINDKPTDYTTID